MVEIFGHKKKHSKKKLKNRKKSFLRFPRSVLALPRSPPDICKKSVRPSPSVVALVCHAPLRATVTVAPFCFLFSGFLYTLFYFIALKRRIMLPFFPYISLFSKIKDRYAKPS